jgi:thymidylate synthase ThyX
MTEGIHRGGQDDIDSHAKRFNNRIVRSSTRLAEFGDEKSSYYKDKILTTDEAVKILNINLPDSIQYNGLTYVKTTNGYILEDMKDNKDVKRGLYMLSIPSNFVSQIDLCEFAHVYKERGEHGTANPEVKEWAESISNQLEEWFPQFNREFLMKILN